MLICYHQMSISSINPVDGSIIKEYQEDTENVIDQKIGQVHQAWLNYKETDFQTRSGLLLQAARILTERKDQLAKLMALEMGKPLNAGVAEILKCASVCEYYAKNGAEFLDDQIIKTGASKSYVSFQPIGVVLAIMPWNFPF
jgi:succinate-semialdehyde dehydrogenase/glutarate-semialdehyde dehydrogenase